MRHRLIFVLAPAAALAAATVAFAQPAGPGHEMPMRQGGPASEEMKARHEAMRKQHAEDLKAVLRLRPDQEAALNAFLASHEPQRFEMKLGDARAMTTPQRLEQMAKHEEAMRAAHAKRREALGKFYAALSPEQQKAFDALHRLQGHRGHGSMMGGPGGRMMMMHGGPGQRRMIIRRGGPGGPHDD